MGSSAVWVWSSTFSIDTAILVPIEPVAADAEFQAHQFLASVNLGRWAVHNDDADCTVSACISGKRIGTQLAVRRRTWKGGSHNATNAGRGRSQQAAGVSAGDGAWRPVEPATRGGNQRPGSQALRGASRRVDARGRDDASSARYIRALPPRAVRATGRIPRQISPAPDARRRFAYRVHEAPGYATEAGAPGCLRPPPTRWKLSMRAPGPN